MAGSSLARVVPGLREALDLARAEMRITEDSRPFADSSVGAARDPVAAPRRVCQSDADARGGAKAGTFVTTGSWTGMVLTRHGAKIAADFGLLGRVYIAFPAS